MSLLSRQEWLGKLAQRIGGGLSGDDSELAADLVALGGRELTAALIASSVAAMHSNGRLLDEIAERVATGRWMQVGVDPSDAVTGAISTFRAGRFPGPKWWDAVLVEVSLLECWADQALRSAPRDRVEDLLRTRWLVEDAAIPRLARGLGEAAPNGPLEEIHRRAAFSSPIAQALAREETKMAMEAERTTLPKEFQDHREVLDLGSAIGFVRSLAQSQAIEVVELRRVLTALIEEELLHLSMVESTALLPAPKAELAVREVAEESRKRLHMPTLAPGLIIVNGLSDRFEGATFAADTLKDDIFSAGARSGLLAWGPTPYLWLALESHELPPNRKLFPLSLSLAGEGPWSSLRLQIATDDEDPLGMDYRIGNSDETRRWLALLVLTGRIMVDLFELDREGHLRLLERVVWPAAELVEKLRPQVEAMAADIEPVPFLTGRELEEHVLAGFGLSENAKSELLLVLADATASEDVSEARGQLLDAEVERARALYAGEDPTRLEARVETAMREYSAARSRNAAAGRRRLDTNPVEAHSDLVADFARDGRAVVHYNYKSGRIQGFWSANGGAARGWIPGEEIDLGALVMAARPWLEGDHGDVDALLATAAPIATELDAAFGEAEVDIEEVVVLPWAVLNGVPFAAIPLGDDTLGARYRISYAPSLGLIRPLVETAPSTKTAIELVSAHGGSLTWADAEIAAAGAIHVGSTVTPDRSTRADVLAAIERGRIIHLATHGQFWRDDPFASSLDLHFGGVPDNHISAAEIYRDVDLRGAELVALAACDTGRSPTLRQGIETYSGLDAAFISKGAKAVISSLWPINDLAAMLFMTTLHAGIAAGKDLPTAFEFGVEFLRSGQLADLPSSHPTAIALETAGVEWRDSAERLVDRFREPRIWAAFKLSGVPWLSQPLPPARQNALV